jgi:hypothetical protein
MPSLAELLGIAPLSDGAMQYFSPPSNAPSDLWRAWTTTEPWPFIPSTRTFAPEIPRAMSDADYSGGGILGSHPIVQQGGPRVDGYSGGGILGDHPIVRQGGPSVSGGILGGQLPASPVGAPVAPPIDFRSLAGPGPAGPITPAASSTTAEAPATIPDAKPQVPGPNPAPAPTTPDDSGFLGRVIGRVKENFSDAYAEPLGPGPEYRAWVKPFVTPSGTWFDAVSWPSRTIYQALMLNVPQLADAVLRFPRPVYDSLIDGLVEHGVASGVDRSGMEQLGRDLKAIPEAFPGSAGMLRPASPAPFAALARAKPVNVALTGQIHHAIAKKIHDALQEHPNLIGQYTHRDPRFVTQAIDYDAHKGYQEWHRLLDREIADHVQNNLGMTPQQFESYLRSRYDRPDLLARFPRGL